MTLIHRIYCYSVESKKILISLSTATLLFSGCGGGSTSVYSSPTNTTNSERIGYLVDSPVQGIDYTCGGITGITDHLGGFKYDVTKCPNGVEFEIGSLSLGSIAPASINSDTYLTIQELAGKTRNDVNNETVEKIAVLLQSLDSNNNPDDGIMINQDIKNRIALNGNIKDKTNAELDGTIRGFGIIPKSSSDALNHLLNYTKSIDNSVKGYVSTSFLHKFLNASFISMGINSDNKIITVGSFAAFGTAEGGTPTDTHYFTPKVKTKLSKI